MQLCVNTKNHGVFVGRIWDAHWQCPSVVTVRDDRVYDISSKAIPTMADLLELSDPVEYVNSASATPIMTLMELQQQTLKAKGNSDITHLLAPNDLQAIKACGVTFASSMVERVIEEQAKGDYKKANEIRQEIADEIGVNLKNIEAGSKKAEKTKQILIAKGLWSQYLEVGIGPDAEVFTKSQVLSAVGWGSDVGLHPISQWNNPEPEIVLAVNSKAKVQGATLGNDVNLRDIEGRSALLLGKAKDNNASCAIGPFIRLFDHSYNIDDVCNAHLSLQVLGEDDYMLNGESSMREISRSPLDLVAQTCAKHHQYPDGFMLFLGTLFAPTQDRDVEGQGFTHKIGDVVSIANEQLGYLQNTVRLSTQCKPWTFGIRSLMNAIEKRYHKK